MWSPVDQAFLTTARIEWTGAPERILRGTPIARVTLVGESGKEIPRHTATVAEINALSSDTTQGGGSEHSNTWRAYDPNWSNPAIPDETNIALREQVRSSVHSLRHGKDSLSPNYNILKDRVIEYYTKKGLECSDSEIDKVMASSQLRILRQRLDAMGIAQRWIDSEIFKHMTDARQIGETLTAIANWAIQMPECATAFFTPPGWRDTLNSAYGKGGKWKAARIAIDKIMHLRMEHNAGLYDNRMGDHIIVDEHMGVVDTDDTYGLPVPHSCIYKKIPKRDKSGRELEGQHVLRRVQWSKQGWDALLKYTAPLEASNKTTPDGTQILIAGTPSEKDTTLPNIPEHNHIAATINAIYADPQHVGPADPVKTTSLAEHTDRFSTLPEALREKALQKQEGEAALDLAEKLHGSDFGVKKEGIDNADIHGDEKSMPSLGNADDEKLPPDTPEQDLWWFPSKEQDNMDDPGIQYFLEQWNTLIPRQKIYIKSIKVGEEGNMIAPHRDPAETPEARARNNSPTYKEARAQERSIARTVILYAGIKRKQEFDVNPWAPPTVKSMVFDETFLTLISPQAVYDPPRALPSAALEEAIRQTEEMIRTGLCTRGASAFNHNVLCVAKPLARGDSKPKWRVVNDLRHLNARTIRVTYPLRPAHESLEQAGGHEWYSCSDAVAGYHQLLVDPAIRHRFSYSVGPLKVTPTRVPMGSINAMSAFQYALSRTMQHMNRGCCELCKRNKMYKDAEERCKDTRATMTKPDDSAAPDVPVSMAEVLAQLGEFDRGKMEEWIEQSKLPHPVVDGEIPFDLDEQHECTGVPIDMRSHTCKGLNYVDDVFLGVTPTKELTPYKRLIECIRCLTKLLDQLDEHGLRLKAQKTDLLVRTLTFLGWHIDGRGMTPNNDKMRAFQKMQAPGSPTEVMSATGGLQYYRKCIPGAAQIESKLHELTRKGVPWQWTPEHESAWQSLKDRMCSDAILTPFDPGGGEVVILTDSSNIGIGAVLAQRQPDGEERPCFWASTTFTKAQRGWSPSEREFAGVKWALETFHTYCWGRRVRIVTDHACIRDIIRKRSLSSRLNKWSLALQGIDAIVEVRRGTHIPVPDMLSRFVQHRDAVRSGQGANTGSGDLLKTDSEEGHKIPEDLGQGIAKLGYLKWGNTGEAKGDLECLVQDRRRLVRALIHEAARKMEGAFAAENPTYKALRDAMDKYNGQTEGPDYRSRIEETALKKIGGLEKLCEKALDEEAIQTIKRAHPGSTGWGKQLALVKENRDGQYTDTLRYFSHTDTPSGGPKDELLKDIIQDELPEGEIVTTDRDDSFIAQVDWTEKCGDNRAPQPVFADMFCGAGGFSAGFLDCGFRMGTTCDKGSVQRQSMKHRYGITPVRRFEHIRLQHLRGAFVGLASAPCTPFARSGHQQRSLDDRSQYFVQQADAYIHARTPVILLENVVECTEGDRDRQHLQGHTLKDDLILKLQQAGYLTQERQISPVEHGGCTHRPRLFIQAIRSDLAEQLRSTLKARIDADDTNEGMEVSGDDPAFAWPIARAYSEEAQAVQRHMDSWEDTPDKYKLTKERVGEFRYHPKYIGKALRIATTEDSNIGTVHDPNAMWWKGAPCPSITAFGNSRIIAGLAPKRNNNKGIQNLEARRLQPSECLRVMGFEGRHTISHGSEESRYEMAGNSVHVNVSRALASVVKAYYCPQWMKMNLRERATQNPAYQIRHTASKSRWYPPKTTQHNRAEEPDTDNDEIGLLGEKLRTERDNMTLSEDSGHSLAAQERDRHVLEAYDRYQTQHDRHKTWGGAAPKHRSEIDNIEEDTDVRHTMVVNTGEKNGWKQEQRQVRERNPHRVNREVREVISSTRKQMKASKLSDSEKIREDDPWGTIKRLQRRDPWAHTLLSYYESWTVPQCPLLREHLRTEDNFTTKDGILYRVGKSQWGDEILQLYIPPELQGEMAKQAHLAYGHASADNAYTLLSQRYWWPKMRQSCAIVKRYCDACQRFKDTKPTTGTTGYTGYTRDADIPCHTILMDFIGPYGTKAHATGNDNRSALVIEDEFTRWIRIYPCSVQTSEFVARCILDWSDQHGAPQRIKSDQGSTLISDNIRDFEKMVGTTHTYSASHRPNSHGKVENANSFIHSQLRAALCGDCHNWDAAVSRAAYAWNTSPKKPLGGYTPFYMLYGRSPYHHFEKLAPRLDTPHTRASWVEHMQTELAQRHQEIKNWGAHYKSEMLRQAQRRWKERAHTPFEPGERVKIYLPQAPAQGGLASKLQARWITGYKIDSRARENHTYKVTKQFAQGSKITIPIHASRIKRHYSTDEPHRLTPHCKVQQSGGDDSPDMDEEMAHAIMNGNATPPESLGTHPEQALQNIRDLLATDWTDITNTGLEYVTLPHQSFIGPQQADSSRQPPPVDPDIQTHTESQIVQTPSFHENTSIPGEQEAAMGRRMDRRGEWMTWTIGKATTVEKLTQLLRTKETSTHPVTQADIVGWNRPYFPKISETYKFPKDSTIKIKKSTIPSSLIHKMVAMVPDSVGPPRGQEWKIHSIIDDRIGKRGREFLVKWPPKDVGPGDKAQEWVLGTDVSARKAITEYENRKARARNQNRIEAILTDSHNDPIQVLEDNPEERGPKWRRIRTADLQHKTVSKLRKQPQMGPAVSWGTGGKNRPHLKIEISHMAGGEIDNSRAGWALVSRIHVNPDGSITQPEAGDEDSNNTLGWLPTELEEDDSPSFEPMETEADGDPSQPEAGGTVDKRCTPPEETATTCGKTNRIRNYAASSGRILELPGPDRFNSKEQNEHAKRIAKGRIALLAKDTDHDIQILDIRDIAPHLEADDVDRLFTGLHKSEIWGLVVGDAAKLAEPLWNALEIQMPKSIVFIGTTHSTSRNQKETKRQKTLQGLCLRNRKRAPKLTAWTADSESRCEFLRETQHLFSKRAHQAPMTAQRNRGFRREQGELTIPKLITGRMSQIWELANCEDADHAGIQRLLAENRMANAGAYQLRINMEDERIKHPLSIAECIQRDIHDKNSGISVGSRVDTLLRFEQLVVERLSDPRHVKHSVPTQRRRGEFTPKPATARLLNRIRTNDGTLTVLKLKGIITEDSEPAVNAIIDALATNTHVQILYIQGFERGMRDTQLDRLTEVLKQPSCGIWAMNIGESPNISRDAWCRLREEMPHTKLGAMFAEPNHLPKGLKGEMIGVLRENRKKFDMHDMCTHPDNVDTIERCEKMWWNPRCSKSNEKFRQQRRIAENASGKILTMVVIYTKAQAEYKVLTNQNRDILKIELDPQSTSDRALSKKVSELFPGQNWGTIREALVADIGADALTHPKGDARIYARALVSGTVADSMPTDTLAWTPATQVGRTTDDQDCIKHITHSVWNLHGPHCRTIDMPTSRPLVAFTDDTQEPKGIQIRASRDIEIGAIVGDLRVASAQCMPSEYQRRRATGQINPAFVWTRAAPNGDVTYYCCDGRGHGDAAWYMNDSTPDDIEPNCKITPQGQICTTTAIAEGDVMTYRYPVRAAHTLGGNPIEKPQTPATTEEQVLWLQSTHVDTTEDAQLYMSTYKQIHGNDGSKAHTADLYPNFYRALTVLEEATERLENYKERVPGVSLNWDTFHINNACTLTIPHANAHLASHMTEGEINLHIHMSDENGSGEGRARTIPATIEDNWGETNGDFTIRVNIKKLDTTPTVVTGEISPLHRSTISKYKKLAIDKLFGPDASPNTQLTKHILTGSPQWGKGGDDDIGQILESLEKEWEHEGTSESQKRAIMHTFRNHLTLIQGPPGTGKTRTIAALAARVAHARKKHPECPQVMICTPTNQTVQELTNRLAGIRLPDGDTPRTVWVASKAYQPKIPLEMEERTMQYQAAHNKNRTNHKGEPLMQRLTDIYKRKRAGEKITETEERQYRLGMKDSMKDILSRADVIICTIPLSGAPAIQTNTEPFLIIDEAGMCRESDALIPLSRAGRIVLVGDQQQISARQTARVADQLGLASAFHRLAESGRTQLLRECRRGPAQSGLDFLSEHRYDNLLTFDPVVEADRAKRNTASGIWTGAPQAFMETGGVEHREKGQYSIRNTIEANASVQLAEEIIRHSKGQFTAEDIAIISLYSAQVTELRKLVETRSTLKGWGPKMIGTVDTWQGNEKPIVIVSTVRSKPSKSGGGFYKDPGRTCVALSRQTHGVIVLGNYEALRHDPLWGGWITRAQQRGGMQICTLQREPDETTEAEIACVSEPCEFCRPAPKCWAASVKQQTSKANSQQEQRVREATNKILQRARMNSEGFKKSFKISRRIRGDDIAGIDSSDTDGPEGLLRCWWPERGWWAKRDSGPQPDTADAKYLRYIATVRSEWVTDRDCRHTNIDYSNVDETHRRELKRKWGMCVVRLIIQKGSEGGPSRARRHRAMGDILGAMRYALHLQHECKAAYTENPTNQDSKRRQPTGTTYLIRDTYISRLEGQASDDTSAFSEYADTIRATGFFQHETQGSAEGSEKEPLTYDSDTERNRRKADKFPAVCMALKGREPAAVAPGSVEEETQRQIERLSTCPFNRRYRTFGVALEQAHIQCRLGGPLCSYSKLVNRLERDIQAQQHAYVSALGEYLTKLDESEKETKNQLEIATRIGEQITTFRAAREYFRTIENLHIRLQAQKTVERLWSARKPITFDDNRLEVAWRRANDTLCNRLGKHWYEPEELSNFPESETQALAGEPSWYNTKATHLIRKEIGLTNPDIQYIPELIGIRSWDTTEAYYRALIAQSKYPRETWESSRQKWERSSGLNYTLQEHGTKAVDDTSGETIKIRHPMCDANDFKTDQWQQTAGAERCGPPVKPYLGKKGHRQDEDGTSALFAVETQSTNPAAAGGSSNSSHTDTDTMIEESDTDTSHIVEQIIAELTEVQQGVATRAMVGDVGTERHYVHWKGTHKKDKEGRLITEEAQLRGDNANIVQFMKIRRNYNVRVGELQEFSETNYLEWWKPTDLAGLHWEDVCYIGGEIDGGLGGGTHIAIAWLSKDKKVAKLAGTGVEVDGWPKTHEKRLEQILRGWQGDTDRVQKWLKEHDILIDTVYEANRAKIKCSSSEAGWIIRLQHATIITGIEESGDQLGKLLEEHPFGQIAKEAGTLPSKCCDLSTNMTGPRQYACPDIDWIERTRPHVILCRYIKTQPGNVVTHKAYTLCMDGEYSIHNIMDALEIRAERDLETTGSHIEPFKAEARALKPGTFAI